MGLAESSGLRGLDALLDAGHGSCMLRDPRLARIAEAALWYFDGRRYRLIAWVIMPNHVHVLIQTLPGHPLSHIVHSWKSFTSKEANALLARTGRFWQPEYFDRAIRDEHHLTTAIRYIHENPVKAGLVASSEDWLFSSAAHTRPERGAGETPALPNTEAR